jgi:signal peptidase I
LRLHNFNPSLFAKKGSELSLSRELLIKLLVAVLKKGGSFRFRTKGFSMYPFIRDGDVITISPISNNRASFGEIVAFINPGTRNLVVHRVIGRSGNFYFIKGDNSSGLDCIVHKTSILGCVTKIERKGKKGFLDSSLTKYTIAFLSRLRILFPLMNLMRRIFRFIISSFSLGN